MKITVPRAFIKGIVGADMQRLINYKLKSAGFAGDVYVTLKDSYFVVTTQQKDKVVEYYIESIIDRLSKPVNLLNILKKCVKVKSSNYWYLTGLKRKMQSELSRFFDNPEIDIELSEMHRNRAIVNMHAYGSDNEYMLFSHIVESVIASYRCNETIKQNITLCLVIALCVLFFILISCMLHRVN